MYTITLSKKVTQKLTFMDKTEIAEFETITLRTVKSCLYTIVTGIASVDGMGHYQTFENFMRLSFLDCYDDFSTRTSR